MKGGGLSGPVGLAQALAQTALCNAELVLHRSWSLLVVTFGSGSQAMLNLPSHLSVYFLHESLVLAQGAVGSVGQWDTRSRWGGLGVAAIANVDYYEHLGLSP